MRQGRFGRTDFATRAILPALFFCRGVGSLAYMSLGFIYNVVINSTYKHAGRWALAIQDDSGNVTSWRTGIRHNCFWVRSRGCRVADRYWTAHARSYARMLESTNRTLTTRPHLHSHPHRHLHLHPPPHSHLHPHSPRAKPSTHPPAPAHLAPCSPPNLLPSLSV